jgi:hypothetical protein
MTTWRMAAVVSLVASAGLAQTFEYKQRVLKDLVAGIPSILESQDRKTGRFGSGIWIVNDQNVMLPLAAAWSYRSPRNPYYRSTEVLNAIMLGGDALIADANPIGKWVFRKKDGSTWGDIYMPWTYSRWVRAYRIVRGAMPQDRREKWDRALQLGYAGIRKEIEAGPVKNIPAHHAMGLWFAGEVFEKPEWKKAAADFLHRVVADQHADGYWSEHKGPVVAYGFVYVDALGVYYAVSKDAAVLPALAKTSRFHAAFTYPDGTPVETVDERNPYHGSVHLPNVGFTFTPEGRGYAGRQLAKYGRRIPADEAASMLLWGQEGETAASSASGDFDYVLGPGDAAVRRRGPWFLVASAMTSPLSTARWIQDRQNFVSVYHDKLGLILGGGNTKLQPRWSNFTAGPIDTFRHRAGDEDPKFKAPEGVAWIPEAATMLKGDDFGVELKYGDRKARIALRILGPDRLEYAASGDPSLTAHVTVLPDLKAALASASGRTAKLGAERIEWRAADVGASIEHRGARYSVPTGAGVLWPLLPHNPYRKDGHAEADEGRIVIDVPLAGGPRTITVEVR